MHRKVLFLCLKFGVDMAKQTINLGSNANDGSGDAVRTAFTKTNGNTSELYSQLGADSNGNLPSAIPVSKGGTGATDASIARSNLGVNSNEDSYLRAIDGATSPDDIIDPRFTFIANAPNCPEGTAGHLLSFRPKVWNRTFQIYLEHGSSNGSSNFYFRKYMDGSFGEWKKIYCTGNTTIDGNGYIKPSSPVVRLYADKIETINEAINQGITFEKLGVGNYLVKNTTGLRDDGWYIETPRDSNGNVLVFVEFTELENKDISVKTFKKKFDIETASIVADHDKPMDIPQDRWIDLRFNDYPLAEQPTLEATA